MEKEIVLNKIAKKYLFLYYKINLFKEEFFTVQENLKAIEAKRNNFNVNSSKKDMRQLLSLLYKTSKSAYKCEKKMTKMEKNKGILDGGQKANVLYKQTLQYLKEKCLLEIKDNRLLITPQGSALIEKELREKYANIKTTISLIFSGVALIIAIVFGILTITD